MVTLEMRYLGTAIFTHKKNLKEQSRIHSPYFTWQSVSSHVKEGSGEPELVLIQAGMSM